MLVLGENKSNFIWEDSDKNVWGILEGAALYNSQAF